nr:transformation/transcription domain-associated protein-like isoform X2 [Tanacetum cinerariifolium]
MAEKSVFKILLMTIIAASAEPNSIDPKDDYVTNVCRHFAIIFHMENSSTNTLISAIFLGGPLLSSNTNNSFKSINGSSSSLIELDPLIFLDALVKVLADEDRLHAKSALNALNVFRKTLPLLGQTCYQVNESYLFANSNGWGYQSWCISGKVTVEKGWISWGSYCDMAHDEIWLEYTMNCFIQGIKFGIPNSKSHLARVMYLIGFDTPNEPVGRAFDKFVDQILHWVWLSWIPQLLLSLQRSEFLHCKLVLLKVATVYRQ